MEQTLLHQQQNQWLYAQQVQLIVATYFPLAAPAALRKPTSIT